MKIRILKLQNWLLATLVGAFGLSACHSTKEVASPNTPGEPEVVEPQKPDDPQVAPPDPREPIAVMYGVPTMNFVVKGKVVNEQGKPVPGMQVILLNRNVDITPDEMHEDNEYVLEYIRRASDTTDAEGNYIIQTSDTPADRGQIIIRDIDGKKRGLYKNQMIEVNYQEGKQTEPRQGWNMGTIEKEETITVWKE